MDMTRRQLISALSAVAAAAGVGAEAECVEREPKPLLAVLTYPHHLPMPVKVELMETWAALRERTDGLPELVILDGGADLKLLVDPRAQK